MPENAPSTATVPEEVLQRLNDWKGLWTWSAGYHYLFGVSGVAASSLAVLEFSDECRWIPKVLAAIAAICLAVLGFVQPDRRYQKFVRAWRALDPVVLRYRYGKATLDEVFAALERGESIISDYEQQISGKQDVVTGGSQ